MVTGVVGGVVSLGDGPVDIVESLDRVFISTNSDIDLVGL